MAQRLKVIDTQCDKIKSPNVYKSCPKIGFTTKMIDFDTFTKIAEEWGSLRQINCCQKKLPKVQ